MLRFLVAAPTAASALFVASAATTVILAPAPAPGAAAASLAPSVLFHAHVGAFPCARTELGVIQFPDGTVHVSLACEAGDADFVDDISESHVTNRTHEVLQVLPR